MGKWEQLRAQILADPERLAQYRETRRKLREWVASYGGDPDTSEINMVYPGPPEVKINAIAPETEL